MLVRKDQHGDVTPVTMAVVRTTIELDDDTAKAVETLRREQGMGTSEAVNTLIRRGGLHREPEQPFRQATRHLGLRIDVSNTAEALEILEGVEER
jgi:hypothetical protein